VTHFQPLLFIRQLKLRQFRQAKCGRVGQNPTMGRAESKKLNYFFAVQQPFELAQNPLFLVFRATFLQKNP
jgi:hypothetical protein